MKEFIKKFLDKWLCMHDWENFLVVKVSKEDDFSNKKYSIRHFKCKKCGKFHKIKSS